MIRSLRLIILLTTTLCITSKGYAQFPYVESFRNSSASGITFGGTPSAFLTAAGSGFSNGNHTGTPIDPEGNGFLRLTNAANDQKGYAISNATFPSTDGLSVEFEYYIYGGSGADGISFFLFDATASPFNIGAYGGSLGYAQTTNPILTPGVSKGYLAVGLDEYGNFANPNEGRQGGISFKPGAVSLRGKGDGSALTPENYKWLATTQENTATFPFSLVGNASTRISNPTSSGYRKVLMLMEPNVQGGYNITVKITRGGSPQITATVIDRYHYSEAAPQTLRYGFASSTGFHTNFHEVRNVTIDILDPVTIVPPVAVNDLASVCQNTQAVINVAANDFSNNTGGVINKESIDLDPNTAGVQNVFTVPTRGVFAVTSGGFVQFTPSTAFIGQVTCNYNIKDGVGAVSNNATITVNYLEAPAMPNAGADQQLTLLTIPTSTIIQATNPNTNSGVWTQVSGPSTASFANATAFSTTASNLINGTYVFRWTVRSAGGCELFDEVQVLVNRRPVAVNDEVTTNLNINVNIPVIANDTDADGNNTILKSSIVVYNQPHSGTLIFDHINGTVTYRPNTGFSGIDNFTYTIKDDHGAESNIATVTIAVNVKPVGVPDNSVTPAQIPITIRVLDNDNIPTGSKAIKASNPSNGTVVLNSDGTFLYTPNPEFSGTDIFTYKVVNKDGLESDPITVTIKVLPTGSNDNAVTSTNTPVIVGVKDNDLSKLGTSVVIGSNPFNGTVTINSSGNPVYTPAAGFSGIDTFTYLLRTADGVESLPITVTVRVKPLGSPDNVTTPFNTVITIPVKINDLSKTGTTVIQAALPTHGTVSIDANGNMVYTPNSGYIGTDTYTYILRTADGVESDPIMVNVTIKSLIVVPAPNISTGAVSGDPKIIDIPIPVGGSIIIITPPKHGTITFDPVTGKPIYTPNPGYTGPDDFVYIVKDADGNTSNPGTVTVTVSPALLPAKIGLAKALTTSLRNADGSYDLTYNFTIVNSGEIALSNLSLTDDLTAAFPGSTITVIRLAALGSLIVNNSFNGTGNNEMLSNASTLAAKSKEIIELKIKVVVGLTGGEFRNSAISTGTSVKTGLPVTDISTNGFNPDPQTSGDFTPNDPTPVTLLALTPAKIGLAKALTKTKKNVDGTYDLSYTFTIVNTGDIGINNLSLTDNLATTFPGATIKVTRLAALGSLIVNSSFNGMGVNEMLSSTSSIAAKSKEIVQLDIHVTLGETGGEFRNSATVSGVSARTGLAVTDISTNGLNPDPQASGDFSPNDPTPVTLAKDNLLIPGGFSPNNDGINDFFVVENTSGKQIKLEVFNRWANLVYISNSYQNNWDGKTMKGIHVGEDLPAGTYYYIITIDNKDKRVGNITINR